MTMANQLMYAWISPRIRSSRCCCSSWHKYRQGLKLDGVGVLGYKLCEKRGQFSFFWKNSGLLDCRTHTGELRRCAEARRASPEWLGSRHSCGDKGQMKGLIRWQQLQDMSHDEQEGERKKMTREEKNRLWFRKNNHLTCRQTPFILGHFALSFDC